MTVSRTVRMPDNMANSLVYIGSYLDRSTNYLITKAIENYIMERMEDIQDLEDVRRIDRESSGKYITLEEAAKRATEMRSV